MHEVLFLRNAGSTEPESLATAASKVFAALGIDITEVRDSANYEQGHYHLGHATNVAVNVCHSDGSEMPEYPFWLVLSDQVLRKDAEPSIDPTPQVVAAQLASAGMQVFIPTKGWGQVGWVPSGVAYDG